MPFAPTVSVIDSQICAKFAKLGVDDITSFSVTTLLRIYNANVSIGAHNKYYAMDMFTEFWEWLCYMAEEGSIAMPLETFEEVRGGADAKKDLLNEWLCRHEVEETLVLPK